VTVQSIARALSVSTRSINLLAQGGVIEKRSGGWIFDVRDRDVMADELAAEFNKETCRWTILGNAGELHRSAERDAILNVFRETQRLTPSGTVTLSPKKVTEILGTLCEGKSPSYQAVKQNLFRMAQNGLLRREARGEYSLLVS
jgi:hypothetical protein